MSAEPMNRRQAYVAGLRAMANLLDSNPILPLPSESLGMGFYLRSEDAVAALAVLEGAGLTDRTVQIDLTRDSYSFNLSGRLHGLKVYAAANPADVCVATGTRTVATYAYIPPSADTPAPAACSPVPQAVAGTVEPAAPATRTEPQIDLLGALQASIDRARRYGQCDGTCTTDCGHCKGNGVPA